MRPVSVITQLITYRLVSGTNKFQYSDVSVINESKIYKTILYCTFYVKRQATGCHSESASITTT